MRAVRLASAASIAAAIVLAVACDFPSPLLFDVDAAATDSGGSSDGDGAAPPTDASEDVVSDAQAEDADAKPCAKPCDCDDDGFLSLECDGSDCDDDDPFRFPDAGFSTRIPAEGKNGDWNCDGVEEKNERTGAMCEGTPLGECADASGFEGNPSCGQTATRVQCGASGEPPMCLPIATPLRTVQCR